MEELKGWTPRQKSFLGIAWAVTSVVFAIEASIVGPSAAILAAQVPGATVADLAPVLGLGGLAMLVGGMPSGWLIDNVPGSPLLAGTLLVQAAGFTALAWCRSIPQMVITYGVIAFTFNILNTGINVMAIWLWDSDGRRLGFWLNLISACFGFGGILAPQVVNAVLATSMSPQTIFYLVSGLAACMAVLMVVMRSPTAPAAAKKKAAAKAAVSGAEGAGPADLAASPECASLGVAAAAGATAADAEQASMQGSAAASPAASSSFRQRQGRAWSVLLPALLLVFSNVAIELGFGGWIVAFATERAGLGLQISEMMASAYWLAFTLARVAAVLLATVLQPASILLITMPAALLGPVMPLVMLRQPAPADAAAAGAWGLSPEALVCCSAVLVGVGAAAGFPNTLSIAAEYDDLDGFMNGLISTVAGLSVTTFPALVPYMAKRDPSRGFDWLMIMTLAMGALQLAALLWMLAAGRAHKSGASAAADGGEEGAPRLQQQPEPSLLARLDSDLRAPLLTAADGDMA